jgi:hypothetical protein
MQATPPAGVTRRHRKAASRAGVRLAPTSEYAYSAIARTVSNCVSSRRPIPPKSTMNARCTRSFCRSVAAGLTKRSYTSRLTFVEGTSRNVFPVERTIAMAAASSRAPMAAGRPCRAM